ncbi:Uncharacterised protein [uncultured archaeon]|nr:Uncharacterised protein [uncultured archaeon]
MESAKKALGITKYFVSLPSAKQLAALLLLIPMLAGALLAALSSGQIRPDSLVAGAGSALFIISLPSFIAAGALSLLRRRVQMPRALALALLSAIVYLAFYMLAVLLTPVSPAAFNLIFIGFGLAFFLWLSTLKFAFGLERSAWLFALAQAVGYSLFLIAGSTLYVGALSDVLLRVGLSAAVFVAALYGLLSLTSGPLKKNLGLKSSDVLSGFSSQWLYGEKDLEDTFEEIGEDVSTYVALAQFRTKQGTLQWVVPYVHFGPFGNLGGSQFSSLMARELASPGVENFIYHGTCTHDFDPVSTGQMQPLVAAVRAMGARLKPKNARFDLRRGSAGTSRCYWLGVNEDAILSFSRAPLSTEDVNFAIGCSLMHQAGAQARESMVIDCHNAETGDVDYVEPGSEVAFEMEDALASAMKEKRSARPMMAGWARTASQIGKEETGAGETRSGGDYESISGVGDGGVMATCLGGRSGPCAFFVLLDSNGITAGARERLLAAVQARHPKCFAEVLTTDTHQLNSVRGVFNPAGAEEYEKLEAAVLEACEQAFERMQPAQFAMAKERVKVRVLGPYQSAEIVATLNSVMAVLKFSLPVALVAAVLLLLWILGHVG